MEHASNTPHQPAEITQAPTNQVDSNVGPCPECGGAVVQFHDRFECCQLSDGGCTFAIMVEDIKKAMKANVADVVLDAVIGDDEAMGDFIGDVLATPGKYTITWHDIDGIFVYFEAEISWDGSSGCWELLITRDDEELAALAAEGYAQRFRM